jgi:hypothetical protein
MKLRTYPDADTAWAAVARVRIAIDHLKTARLLLQEAGSRRARRAASRALKSAEGAPVVEIHVRGGVAYVVRKDANVRVTIRDFDNDPTGRETESYAATAVVQPEAHGQKRR